ncbi:Ig-like domain-containing protein [Neobacillus drentensis]|uniref:Ig-like domain-containing protein n=1 Tax=Neobacillus drentensis TaxID=220684 RepID=UPI0030005F56
MYPTQSFTLRVQTSSDKPIQEVSIHFLNNQYVELNKVNKNTWESTIQVSLVKDYIIGSILFGLEKGENITYYNKNLPGNCLNTFDFKPNNVKVNKYPKPTITSKITRDIKTIIGKALPKSYVNIYVSDPAQQSSYGIGSVQVDASGNFKWNLLEPLKSGGYLTFTAVNSMYFDPADIDAGAVYAESDTVRIPIPALEPTISTKITNKTTKISGRAEPNVKVIAKVSKKIIGTTIANQYNDFNMNIKPIGAGSTVEILTINHNNNESKTVNKIVTDVIPPSRPAVKKVTTKSKSITGKEEKYSLVEIRVKNKLLGRVKATRGGTYSLKIKKMKKGTVIKIVSIDAAKNRSKHVTTKVY